MRYLSEDDLRLITKDLDEDTESALLEKLIELPDQQWQTIDEFKDNPVDGWCWINLSGLVDMACCWDGVFYFNDTTAEHNHDEIWDIRRITHVMPIKTPEAPK